MLQHPKELARQITLIDHGMNFDYRLVFQFVEFKGASASSSLCNSGFARQPCCMAGTMKMFSIGKNIFPIGKKSIVPAMQHGFRGSLDTTARRGYQVCDVILNMADLSTVSNVRVLSTKGTLPLPLPLL